MLTTYQHHFIDIPTGLLLGALCMWAWPFADEGDGRSIAAQWQWTRDPVRWRLAALYAAGALLLGVIALSAGGWALWLLWGSVSLLLVALAYAAIGPGAFQKRADGRLSLAARWLFAPYLRRRVDQFARVDVARSGAGADRRRRVPRPRADRARARRVAFAGVVDLTAEFEIRARTVALAVVPVLDLTRPDADDAGEGGARHRAVARARARARLLRAGLFAQRLRGGRVASGLGPRRDVDAALAIVRAARRSGGPRCATTSRRCAGSRIRDRSPGE